MGFVLVVLVSHIWKVLSYLVNLPASFSLWSLVAACPNPLGLFFLPFLHPYRFQQCQHQLKPIRSSKLGYDSDLEIPAMCVVEWEVQGEGSLNINKLSHKCPPFDTPCLKIDPPYFPVVIDLYPCTFYIFIGWIPTTSIIEAILEE